MRRRGLPRTPGKKFRQCSPLFFFSNAERISRKPVVDLYKLNLIVRHRLTITWWHTEHVLENGPRARHVEPVVDHGESSQGPNVCMHHTSKERVAHRLQRHRFLQVAVAEEPVSVILRLVTLKPSSIVRTRLV
eukprot:CAMPEP_0195596874 /NCGR_PEP_ID=MMETSP0815-20121206/2689_1 /TAXON_ID=97485 /ORGANISM="Prymnesium parvum, Strain Texoma1" /LENGTH=132 /DNA_ID=CAMNT_0040736187 /DNA_START=221 /DNA_END=615 /DNA_ORIENTATION=-